MRNDAWTLEEGLRFVRKLGTHIKRVGFGVALGGSVLHKGHSNKDIDAIVHPFQAPATDMDWDRAKSALRGFGLTRIRDREAVTEGWRAKGSSGNKWVEEWRYGDRRIDVFFMT